MRWVNFCAPNNGLRGVPVGIAPKALRANGLSPFFHAKNPPAVKRPHLYRSRRVICPCERALTISARLLRAFCASLCRARDALLDRYIGLSLLKVLLPGPDQGIKARGDAPALGPSMLCAHDSNRFVRAASFSAYCAPIKPVCT